MAFFISGSQSKKGTQKPCHDNIYSCIYLIFFYLQQLPVWLPRSLCVEFINTSGNYFRLLIVFQDVYVYVDFFIMR